MPEIGLDEEPISPVRREETVTNRKPNRTISSGAQDVHVQRVGHQDRPPPAPQGRSPPPVGDRSRSVRERRARARRSRLRSARQSATPPAMPRQIIGSDADQADDPARGDRAGPDVEHIGAADIVRAHLADRRGSGRHDPGGEAAEELDRRDQHQVGQHPAGGHGRGDPRADDVADAEELRRDLRRDRTGRQRGARTPSPGMSFQSLKASMASL